MGTEPITARLSDAEIERLNELQADGHAESRSDAARCAICVGLDELGYEVDGPTTARASRSAVERGARVAATTNLGVAAATAGVALTFGPTIKLLIVALIALVVALASELVAQAAPTLSARWDWGEDRA